MPELPRETKEALVALSLTAIPQSGENLPVNTFIEPFELLFNDVKILVFGHGNNH